MKKDNFKTIIQIKRIVAPKKSDFIIKEYDYTNANRAERTFNYISYSKRIICLNKKQALIQIASDKYIYNKKDKLFFGANCTIPRHKVREWGKKHDISITIKPEKANVNIISNNWINNLFGYWSSYYDILIDKNNFIEFLELNYNDKVNDLIQSIKDSECDKVLINKHNNSEIIGHEKACYGSKMPTPKENEKIKKEYGIISQYCEMFGNEEWSDNVKNYDWNLLDNSEQKLKDLNKVFNLNDSVTTILDTTLVDVVNESAITIDDEMSDQLKTMLHSTDIKNHVLAMEIIANSNYRTSLHKILLIFREYGGRIWDRPERNHVNFKSLVKFIDLYNWYNPSYDKIIECLIKKNYLTGDILSEFMPLVKEEIESEINRCHSIFKLNTITVSNEVKRYFGLDIAYSEEELKELEENNH